VRSGPAVTPDAIGRRPWLSLTAYIILLGAELNATIERQAAAIGAAAPPKLCHGRIDAA
jgi:hypothetical protein